MRKIVIISNYSNLFFTSTPSKYDTCYHPKQVQSQKNNLLKYNVGLYSITKAIEIRCDLQTDRLICKLAKYFSADLNLGLYVYWSYGSTEIGCNIFCVYSTRSV